MSAPENQSVPLADVGRLLERVLGIPGDDWSVDRWDTEYEGWAGMLLVDCVCDRIRCYCCDGTNLTAEDITLIEAALSAGSDREPVIYDAGDP